MFLKSIEDFLLASFMGEEEIFKAYIRQSR